MGLPIRIPAVTFTYNYPQRFAVRRVLLRLLVPRHPLCALSSLTFFSTFITHFYLLFKDLFLLEKLLFLSLSKLYMTFRLFLFFSP